MQDKLTLRLDQKLIKRAKKHAKKEGTSVSKLVSNYFDALESTDTVDIESSLPPITKSLLGVISENNLTEEDYRDYIIQKHSK